NHQNNDIRHLRAARPHSGKRLMTRSIQESYAAAIDLHMIGTDMLSNTAMFLSRHMGAANGIQQRRLSMVDMPHDGDHRRPWRKRRLLFFHLVFDFNRAASVECNIFNLMIEFRSN